MGLYENTVALSVSVHGFGNARGVDKATLQEVMPGLSDEAARRYVSATRKLVDCEEFAAIKTLDGQMAQTLRRKGIPSYFRKGIYLVPAGQVTAMNEALGIYQKTRADLVTALGLVWQDRWSESQQATAEQFGFVPYPPWEQVQAQFSVEVHWLSLEVPGKLQYLNLDLYQEEQERMRVRLQEVEAQICALLRAEACEQTQTLIERLKGLGTGETKRFAHSHVTDLMAWCQTFLAGRNVTNDAELEHRTKQLREVLEDILMHDGAVPVAVLRSSEGFRQHVIGQLQEIGGHLQALVEDGPLRAFTLDDE